MEASLWSYRLFRSRHRYKRSEAFIYDNTMAVKRGTVQVTVGNVPEEVFRARATLLVIPTRLFSGGVRDEEAVQAEIDAYSHDPRWESTDHLYTCIRFRRQAEIDEDETRGARSFFWFDLNQAEKLAHEFNKERPQVLDGVTAVLLARMSDDAMAEVLDDSRIVIERSGKSPCIVPRFEVGAVTVSTTLREPELDTASLDAELMQLDKTNNEIAAIGRCAFLAASERDRFR